VSDGIVYFGSDDKNVYALDAVTGDVVWVTSTGAKVQSSPAVTDDMVFVGDTDGRLYGLKADSGTIEWMTETGAVIETYSPSVANGVVYMVFGDDDLSAFDAATGALLWKGSTDGNGILAPSIADGAIYIGTSTGNASGNLYTFHLQN
jgi:outer membrane protein assembly factor BamB